MEPHRRSSCSDFPSQPKFLPLLESLCPSPRPTARLPDAHVSAPARSDLAAAYPLRRAPGPGLSPPTPHGAPALLLQRRVPPHLLCSLQLAEAPSRAPLQPWPRLSCSGSLASAAAPSSVVPGSSLVLAWLRPLALDHGGRPWPCSVSPRSARRLRTCIALFVSSLPCYCLRCGVICVCR
ncbi:uncharacterized protein LOC100272680 [Zea mays]|uniref:Uncharacterized protein n=1 Tax=Zea mays TaxID=4577 RepID=B4FPX3_MAIZE|nr:uncharacterized protein LOC100272680 [Zea mays]ACF84166.1 unknown [Zea mays]|eukprot:NP_001140608.1 uncharacterized protein LOC100272680 [Zea mays]